MPCASRRVRRNGGAERNKPITCKENYQEKTKEGKTQYLQIKQKQSQWMSREKATPSNKLSWLVNLQHYDNKCRNSVHLYHY